MIQRKKFAHNAVQCAIIMLNFVQNAEMNLKNNSYYVIGSFYSYQSFFIFNINLIKLSVVLKKQFTKDFYFKIFFMKYNCYLKYIN